PHIYLFSPPTRSTGTRSSGRRARIAPTFRRPAYAGMVPACLAWGDRDCSYPAAGFRDQSWFRNLFPDTPAGNREKWNLKPECCDPPGPPRVLPSVTAHPPEVEPASG